MIRIKKVLIIPISIVSFMVLEVVKLIMRLFLLAEAADTVGSNISEMEFVKNCWKHNKW